MSVNRSAIETHLSERQGADAHPQAKAFLAKAINQFCGFFNDHGWPEAMPNFVLLPPGIIASDPLPSRGYAGWTENNGDVVLWRQDKAGDDFVPVDKDEDGNVIW